MTTAWLDDIRLSPIYAVFGVPATLRLPGDLGPVFTLLVLDKTAGLTARPAVSGSFGQGIGVETIEPAAMARMSAVIEAGIDLAALDQATLTMNGKCWTVVSHRLEPGLGGETTGEVRLVLMEETPDA